MNLAEIGLDKATEEFVVEHLVPIVRAGEPVTIELVAEALNAAARHQMKLIDAHDAVRLVSDRVWCAIRMRGAEPDQRVIDAATIATAPLESRYLLEAARRKQTGGQ